MFKEEHLTSKSNLNEKANKILIDFFNNPSKTEGKLDLSSCDLHSLPSQFHQLIQQNPDAALKITLLNLAHNHLVSLPSWLFSLSNLKILFLLKNKFTDIPAIIGRLSSLTMLSFKENYLQGRLEARKLPPNLTWLILTSNKITELSDDFAERCYLVRKLMLSNNQLETLPPSFGEHMKKLELLRLANNRFEKVPLLLEKLPILTWFSLAGNPCAGGAKTIQDLPSKLAINLDKDYIINWENPFGSGTSGMAFPAIYKQNEHQVVVKRFKSLSGSDGRALDEISISLSAMSVTGIIQAQGFYINEKDGIIEDLYLITERVPGDAIAIASGPSFESCVRSVYNNGISLSKENAEKVVSVVSKAVFGLLEKGICHADVYGHNVLLGERKNGEIVVFLGDLGAAWHFPERNRDMITKMEMRALDVFKKEVFDLIV